MSTERIDGEYQIEPGTIVDASIAASAAIASTKLAPWSANRDAGGFSLENLVASTNSNAAATYGQLLAVFNGKTYKDPCRVSTATALGTYNATGGSSARGQVTAAPNAVDGVSLAVGDRILDRSNTAQSGIYVVTTVGTGSNGVWDRATDFDTDAEVKAGTEVVVTEGTAGADTSYLLITNNPITVGGSSGTVLTWSVNSSLLAGNGLSQTGNVLNVNAANASILVQADNIQVQLSGATLAIDGSGLKVADGGIGATQLAGGVAGAGLNGGAGTALSVDQRQQVFTGNGSQTVFTLAAAPVNNIANVTVRGLQQQPAGVDYTISGTSLTFSTAPRNGWKVVVTYLAV